MTKDKKRPSTRCLRSQVKSCVKQERAAIGAGAGAGGAGSAGGAGAVGAVPAPKVGQQFVPPANTIQGIGKGPRDKVHSCACHCPTSVDATRATPKG